MYCITVDDTILTDPACRHFIRTIQENFCGGLLDKKSVKVKPVNFPPVLNLQKKRSEIGIQEYTLGYLYELNIYLTIKNSIYNEPVKADFSPYKGKQLTLSHIEKLLGQLKAENIRRINLWSELPENEQLKKLMEILFMLPCRKTYFLPLPENKELKSWTKLLKDIDIELKVLVNINQASNIRESLFTLKENGHPDLEILFYVTSTKDVETVEKITKELNILSYAVRPLYTGNNLDFFKEAVYLNEEDILSSDYERREILANTVLNTHYFGKISLLPGGDIYTGLNFPSIGNIESNSLNSLIYHELSEGQSWLRTRNQAPCNACVYRYLCPSQADMKK